jgi:hypothetical protein
MQFPYRLTGISLRKSCVFIGYEDISTNICRFIFNDISIVSVSKPFITTTCYNINFFKLL